MEREPEMAKAIERLSVLKVKNAKKQGRLADGGNLYLSISETGAKSWSFLYRSPVTAKQREAGFGSIDALTLKQARERARQGRALLKEGKDPIEHWREERRAQRPVLTFADAAKEHFAKKFREWKSAKAGAGEHSILTRYAAPLMKLPVDKVETGAVLAVLKPIWEELPGTATRLRQRIEAVLNAGYVLTGADRSNPARWRGHLDHLLPKRNGHRHFAAMPYREVPEFVAELRQSDDPYARALEFVILTGVRVMEGLGARWDEVDFEAKIWTIPPARMKSGREHRAPLCDRAIAILREQLAARPEDQLVFRGSFAPMNAKGCSRLIRRLGRSCTVHGFRSSLRDFISEQLAVPHAVAEACLAHAVGDQTSRAYARSDLLEQRRPVMAGWSQWLAGGRGDVVPLKRANDHNSVA
jgi:integrase